MIYLQSPVKKKSKGPKAVGHQSLCTHFLQKSMSLFTWAFIITSLSKVSSKKLEEFHMDYHI